jgi:DNA-binding transcriptional MerR regulator
MQNVITKEIDMTWMTVGQLAKKSGITVRTLHHYDALGLLTPARRSEAGYRLYGPEEVVRLSRIVCLRKLGLSLEQIEALLANQSQSLQTTLKQHILELEEQIATQQQQLSRLRKMSSQLERAGTVSVDTINDLLETIQMLETYYTKEQLEQLEQQHNAVGEERLQQVQQEWQDVFDGFRKAHAKGLAPNAPEVQQLAATSNALIAEFTGGDPGLQHSLNQMYQDEGGHNVLQSHGYDVDPALFAFMNQAREALCSPTDGENPQSDDETHG